VKYATGSLNAKTAATLHDGSLYSEQLARVFEREFTKAGGTIVAKEAIAPSDTDLRPVLTRIGTTQPQLLFAPLFVSAAAYMTRQSKEVPSMAKTTVLGTDAVLSSAFLEAAGDGAVGYRIVGIDNDPAKMGPRYQKMREAYKQKFGEDPISAWHAQGYDAATALMNAIEKVAKTEPDGTTYIGRQAVRDALMTTKDLDGMTGKLTCDQYGDCGASRFGVFEFVNGDPTTFKEGVNPKRIWP
jgi:branched-chain amino acid transport system substrate-binding protein